jgi:hypothetical protein
MMDIDLFSATIAQIYDASLSVAGWDPRTQAALWIGQPGVGLPVKMAN